jgi:Helix-turn-helix domain of resolvase/Resolvase, N terminal domain
MATMIGGIAMNGAPGTRRPSDPQILMLYPAELRARVSRQRCRQGPHAASGRGQRGCERAPCVPQSNLAAGKYFLDMLGVFAEFETNLRRERQLEGIADAKARGVYQGRKASIDPAKVRALKAEGMGASAIAKALKIGRASVYRALED